MNIKNIAIIFVVVLIFGAVPLGFNTQNKTDEMEQFCLASGGIAIISDGIFRTCIRKNSH